MSVMEELKERVHKLEYLPKKIDKIEYTEIKELRDKIENIEVDLAKNNLLTQQNTEAMNKMSDTMDSVRETMVQMSGAIEYTSRTNKELAENIKQQNEKIDKLQARQDEIQEKMNQNEEKNKIDIRQVLKDNFFKILGTLIGAGILIEMVINNLEVF